MPTTNYSIAKKKSIMDNSSEDSRSKGYDYLLLNNGKEEI